MLRNDPGAYEGPWVLLIALMLAASVVALCNGDDQGAAGATYVGLSHAQRSAAGEPSFVSVRVVFLLTALIVH